MKKELCWNITSKCNQDCIYCFRAQNIQECTLSENIQILEYLNDIGIKAITWSGGEPLLYPHLSNLLKKAKEYSITNKINSNASLFLKNIPFIIDHVDNFTFSLDSIDNQINQKLGRGYNHLKNVDSAISYLKNHPLKKHITINVVASSINLKSLQNLISYLNNVKIDAIRVFQAVPLRDKSIETYNFTKITDEQFDDVKNLFNEAIAVRDISYRDMKDHEKKYLIISQDGRLCYNKNGVDIIVKDLREAIR
jgi:MoaA/NifB/PqqE/SkfB family radical SAM enzyme